VVAELGPDAILGRGAVLPRSARAREQRQGDGERRSPWADDPPLPGDDRYQATVKLARMLEVEAVKKSKGIQVSCTGPSPEPSHAVVACLIDLSLEQHVRLNRTPGALHFLEEQTTRLRARLASAEEELRALKDRTGIASPEAQRQVLVTRIGRLRDELLQAEG